MDKGRLEKILGRPISPSFFNLEKEYIKFYMGKRVLITGGSGSIGAAVIPPLKNFGADVLATDIHDMDVLRYPDVYRTIYSYRPDIILHLAAAKHAPAGEENPKETYMINTQGTVNVLDAVDTLSSAGAIDRPKLVLASTCKACNPETAYGASKLIAERLVLNSGGHVARFYNVIETAGNVFEIWNGIGSTAPIPYTDCSRYFITLFEAVDFIMRVPQLEPGRYTINPGERRWMGDVAHALYPFRHKEEIPQRRGDRVDEPRCAAQEVLECVGFPIERIISQHD